MPTFTLKKVEAIQAKQEVDELLIDGIGQLSAFEKMLAANHAQYLSELRTMLSYIEYAANGNSLPDTRIKDVTPAGVMVKEYEFNRVAGAIEALARLRDQERKWKSDCTWRIEDNTKRRL